MLLQLIFILSIQLPIVLFYFADTGISTIISNATTDSSVIIPYATTRNTTGSTSLLKLQWQKDSYFNRKVIILINSHL